VKREGGKNEKSSCTGTMSGTPTHNIITTNALWHFPRDNNDENKKGLKRLHE